MPPAAKVSAAAAMSAFALSLSTAFFWTAETSEMFILNSHAEIVSRYI
jgi:hypothetical protein